MPVLPRGSPLSESVEVSRGWHARGLELRSSKLLTRRVFATGRLHSVAQLGYSSRITSTTFSKGKALKAATETRLFASKPDATSSPRVSGEVPVRGFRNSFFAELLNGPAPASSVAGQAP